MTKETMELGSAPVNEDCAQVGSTNYPSVALEQCRRYKKLLEAKFGDPPGDAYFKVKSNLHDFGTYYEVAVVYNENDEKEVEFAFHVESNLPETWDDDVKVPVGPRKSILRAMIEADPEKYA